MEKETIDPSLLPPRERLDNTFSIRVTKSQKERIEAFCQRYKVTKIDFFRFMLQDFLKRYKLPENGSRN